MILLSNYWETISFDYVTIYSGLWNEEQLLEIEKTNKQKIAELKEKLLTARYMQQPKISQEIAALEQRTTKIIDKEGNKHPTTEEIITLSKNHWLFQQLSYIVYKYKGERTTARFCSPIYREALVFYSKEHEIQAIVHVCFSCFSVINDKGERLEVADKFYQQLSAFLNEIIMMQKDKIYNNSHAKFLYFYYYTLKRIFRFF